MEKIGIEFTAAGEQQFFAAMDRYVKSQEGAVRATQQATSGITRASQEMSSSIANETDKAASGLKGFAAHVSSVFAGIMSAQIVSGIVNGIKGIASEAFNAVADYELMAMSMQNLVAKEIKSTDALMTQTEAMKVAGPAAKELLGWIEKIAVESPFSSEGVAAALRTQMVYGNTVEEAKRLTAALIDMTAATGQGPDVMNRVAMAMGQMKAAGKATTMDLRQLQNAGVDAFGIIAKSMGVTVPVFQEMVTKGLVPANIATEALTKSFEENYTGAAKLQATALSGLTSSLKDLKAIALRSLFTGVFEGLKPAMNKMLAIISSPKLLETLGKIGTSIGTLFGGIVNSVLGAYDKIGGIIGKVSRAFTGVHQAIVDGETVLKKSGPSGAGNAVKTLLSLLGLDLDIASIVGTKIDEVIGAVTLAWGKLQTTIAALSGANATEGTSGLLRALFGMLGLDANVGEAIGQKLEDIVLVVSGFISGIPARIAGLWATAPGVAIGAGGTFGIVGLLLASFIPPDTLTLIQVEIDNIWAGLQESWGLLKENVAKLFGDIGTGFAEGGIWGGIKAAIAGVPDLLSSFEPFKTALIDALRRAADAAWDAFKAWKPDIASWIETLVTAIKAGDWTTVITQIGGQIKAAALKGLEKLVDWQPGLLWFIDPLGKAIISGDWQPLIDTLGKKIKETVTAGVAWAIKEIPKEAEKLGVKLHEEVNTWWNANGEKMGQDVGKSLGTMLRVAVIAVGAAIGSIIVLLGKVIKGMVTGATDEKSVKENQLTVEQWMAKVLEGFLAGLFGDDKWKEKLKGWFTRFATGAVENIEKTVSAWITAGENLILGLGKGITDKANTWLKSEVAKVANSIPTWVKSLLGIHSPSTVMEPLGFDTIMGFLRGFNKGESDVMAAVVKTIKSLVEAFGQLLDLQAGFGTQTSASGSLAAAMASFRAGIEAIFDVLEGILNKYTYPRIKAVDAIVGKITEMVELALMDFSKIAALTLPDMTVWKANIIAIGEAIIGALESLVKTQAQKNSATLAARFTEIVTTTFGFVKGAVDAIQALSEYVPIPSLLTNLTNFIDRMKEIVPDLVIFSQTLVAKGELETADIKLKSAGGIIGIVKSAIDAIVALAEYVPAESLVDKVKNLSLRLFEVVDELAKGSLEFDTKGMLAAQVFYAAAQGVMGVVKAGIDAIVALSKYESMEYLALTALLFRNDLFRIIYVLSQTGTVWDTEGKLAASAFYAASAGIIAIIKSGIDAIVALSKYESMEYLALTALLFRNDLFRIIYVLSQTGTVWDTEGKLAASAFYAASAGIIAIIKSGIDAIVALGEYKPMEYLALTTLLFRNDIFRIIDVLSQTGHTWDTEGKQAASAFYTACGGILGIIKSGLDAIKDLVTYVPVSDLPSAVGWFRIDLMAVLDNLSTTFAAWDTEGKQAASNFYAACSGMLGIIKPGIDAIVDLVTYEPVSDLPSAVGWFRIDLMAVLDNLSTTFAEWDTEGKQAASNFYAACSGIVGIIKPGIEAIAALAEYTTNIGLADKISDFKNDLFIVLKELQVLAADFAGVGPGGAATSGLEAASLFATAVTTIVGMIKPAIEALAALAEYTGISNLTGKMSIFKSQLTTVLDKIREIALLYQGEDGLDIAVTWSAQVTTVCTTMKGAVDFLTTIAKYPVEQNVAGGMGRFKRELEKVLTLISEMATDLARRVQTALNFEGAAEQVMAAIKSGMGFLAELNPGNFTWALPSIIISGLGGVLSYITGTFLPAWQDAWAAAGRASGAIPLPVIPGRASGLTTPAITLPPTASSVLAGSANYGSSSVSVTFGNVTISNGMDMSTFEARVLQTVRKAVK